MKHLHHALAVIAIFISVLTHPTVAANAATSDRLGDDHATVRLITGVNDVSGTTFEGALDFVFADGWHGYWRTPRDRSFATRIDWSRSENVADVEVRWPAPHRSADRERNSGIYEGQLLLPVRFRVKKPGEGVRLEIALKYVACSDTCVTYEPSLSLALPPGRGQTAVETSLIEFAKTKVPGSPSAAGLDHVNVSVRGSRSLRSLVVEARSAHPFGRPDLFVEGTGVGILSAPKVILVEDGHLALMTIPLPSYLPGEDQITLTLVDWDRAAEFSSQLRLDVGAADRE